MPAPHVCWDVQDLTKDTGSASHSYSFLSGHLSVYTGQCGSVSAIRLVIFLLTLTNVSVCLLPGLFHLEAQTVKRLFCQGSGWAVSRPARLWQPKMSPQGAGKPDNVLPSTP